MKRLCFLVSPHHTSFLLEGKKMHSGVRYDRLRSSSAMARVLPGPLHNLWLIRHIDPKTGST